MAFQVTTYKWEINTDILQSNEHEFDSLDKAWEFLDSVEGKVAEGARVFNDHNEIFVLNPEVIVAPARANTCSVN